MSDQANPAVEDPSAALLGALDDSPEDELEEGAEPETPEEEPEEEEEKPSPVEQKFRVKVKNDKDEDEERDLSLEELAAGYMQQADFTRKTQAAAAAEKQRQEHFHQAVSHTAEQASQQMHALRQMVLAVAAPELQGINWQQLARDEPGRYVELKERQSQLQQTLANLDQEDGRIRQQREYALQQQRDQAARQSLDYLSREIKGFNLEKEAPKLRETGAKYGYTEQEIGSVVDGRFIHLLNDARQWRELQAGKPKAMAKVAEAPRVIKPAAPQPKKTNQAALERLRNTGRASELVNFL